MLVTMRNKTLEAMRAAASLDVEGVRNSWTPGAIGSFADEGYLDYLIAMFQD